MQDRPKKLWRLLTTPIAGTPNFVKHTPSLESVRRGAAVAMAVVVFYTQSVCAGTASLPLLPVSKRPVVAGQLGLLDRLMKFVGADKKGSAYKFHDNVWNDRRKLTGEGTEPGLDPKSLEKMVANQEARRDIENQNRHNPEYQEVEEEPGADSGKLREVLMVLSPPPAPDPDLGKRPTESARGVGIPR